jgi:hypothetical protein
MAFTSESGLATFSDAIPGRSLNLQSAKLLVRTWQTILRIRSDYANKTD